MTRAGSFVLVLVLVLWAARASAQSIFETVKTGTPDQVRALVAKDAALVNAKDASGHTPLHHAAIGGSAAMAELLISLGAAVDGVNTGGGTSLYEAIRARKLEVALVLLAKGAEVRKPGGMRRAALHWAALSDFAAVVAPLVARGADLEQADQHGLTPLVCAVLWSRNVAVVRALLDSGASINARDPRGSTVLDLAIGGLNAAANIDLLLDHGATYPPDRAPRLLQAAAGGAVPLFRRLLDKHGDTLFADAQANRTTMANAILGGSVEIVQTLLARGIAIDNTPNANGLTLLHRVAETPQAAGLIELLVKNGLDIDTRTPDGRSAYNLAAGERNREARRRLMALGASEEPQKFPALTAPCLGQTPPTGDPSPFARGIVINNHGVVTMSPDGQEMYWSSPPSPGAQPPRARIIVTMLRNGR